MKTSVTVMSPAKAALALSLDIFSGSTERRMLLDMLIDSRSGQLFRIANMLQPQDVRRILLRFHDLRSYEIIHLLSQLPSAPPYHKVRHALLVQLVRRSSSHLMDSRTTINDPHDETIYQWWAVYALKSESEKELFTDTLIARRNTQHLRDLLVREYKVYDNNEGWMTRPFLTNESSIHKVQEALERL